MPVLFETVGVVEMEQANLVVDPELTSPTSPTLGSIDYENRLTYTCRRQNGLS